jgi:quercetin dioxygenase-like cupin family protein
MGAVMHLRIPITTTALLLGATLLALAQQSSSALVDAQHKRMQPEQAEAAFGNAVQMTVFGDPSKPGLYAIRRRFKPGEMTHPHYHDQARLVTVIKGTWYTGEGDVFRPDKTIPIKAGGFMYHPKGFHHYDGAKDGEVIVQIIGMGPVRTIRSEVDAHGKPVPASDR